MDFDQRRKEVREVHHEVQERHRNIEEELLQVPDNDNVAVVDLVMLLPVEKKLRMYRFLDFFRKFAASVCFLSARLLV